MADSVDPQRPGDEDLEFADIESAFSFAHIDLRRLRSPETFTVLVGLAVALAVAVWPARTDRVLTRLIGIVLLLAAFEVVRRARTQQQRSLAQAGIGLLVAAIGAVLMVFPDQTIVFVARLFALFLVVFTGRELLSAIRHRRSPTQERLSLAWPIAKAIAGLSSALLVATYPATLLALATILVALGWATLAAMALAHSMQTAADIDMPEARGMVGYRRSGSVVLGWLDDRSKEAEDRRALYAKILFEGAQLKRKVIRFLALMAFASVIASMGVITDSTAVVIGAMLIAPLMTPLMGIAISIVMGWPNRLARSASIALAGIVLAIAIGVLLGLIVPTTIDIATNSQIASRASPTILDLITATAAGAAGAYGLSRPDVSDALPGVAIAIALVPPLSVVGISYSQGAWSEGNGALLLFVTNALAIIIVGGFTFVVMGVAPLSRVAGNQQRVRTATASVVALGAIVVGALGINGGQIAADSLDLRSTDEIAREWLSQAPEHNLVRTQIDGDRVTVVIIGPAASKPSVAELREQLVDELGRDVVADVRVLVQERETVPVDAEPQTGE